MTIVKKIFSAVLLLSLLTMAGCPEVAQQGGGGSSSKEPMEQ